jgi:hypothetical protein
MDMEKSVKGDAPYKGRIIKVKPPAQTQPIRDRSVPGRPSLRDGVAPYFLAVCLLSLSAYYSYRRPLEVSIREVEVTDVAYLTRISELGNEYSSRFTVAGTPIKTTKGPANQPITPEIVAEHSPADLKEVSRSETKPLAERVRMSVEAQEAQVYSILKKYGNPVGDKHALAAAIVREAIAQDYDPVFVAAVIKSESAFNTLAKSNKGAQGLMQLMPKTGAWLAAKSELPKGRLTDPGHNLKLGIAYLKELESSYGGNKVLTLIAYNWGPGRVASASSGSRRVPAQVMRYAIKILNDYRGWAEQIG